MKCRIQSQFSSRVLNRGPWSRGDMLARSADRNTQIADFAGRNIVNPTVNEEVFGGWILPMLI